MTIRQLGEVARFVRGITFKPDDVVPDDTPGTLWCMRTKNVQAELDLSDTWSINSKHVKRQDQYLRQGDLLVSSANSWNLVGKCCWVPELERDASFGGFVSVLRADPSKVDARYLYWWFSSPMVQATVRSFGRQTTNISNLDFARCLKLPIPVPARAAQQRVVEVLDQADMLQAKRRQAITLLDNLSQSIFLDMFGDPAVNPHGWDVVSLGEIGQVQGGLQITPKRRMHPLEIPYLRVANVYRDRLDLQEVKALRVTERELKRTQLQDGDLLIVEGHGNPEEIGRVAVWDGSIDPCTHQNHLIRVRLTSVSPAYACALLNSPGGRRHLLQAASTTSGLNTISSSDVRSTPLMIPPLDVQRQYVERLSHIKHLQAIHQTNLDELDELFDSLQTRAFRPGAMADL